MACIRTLPEVRPELLRQQWAPYLIYLKEFVLGLRVSLRHSSYNTLFGQSTAHRFRRPIGVLNTVYSHTFGLHTKS